MVDPPAIACNANRGNRICSDHPNNPDNVNKVGSRSNIFGQAVHLVPQTIATLIALPSHQNNGITKIYSNEWMDSRGTVDIFHAYRGSIFVE